MTVLEDLKAKEQAATPGPWVVEPRTRNIDGMIHRAMWAESVDTGNLAFDACNHKQNSQIGRFQANLGLSAASRNALPALLALAEAASALDEWLRREGFGKAAFACGKWSELREALGPLLQEAQR